MPTGIELIQQERQEQISKHGFSLEKDAEYYKNGELVQAAEYCLMLASYGHFANKNVFWPKEWGHYFKKKINAKAPINKMVVAGAFYMAENDRRGDSFYNFLIDELATAIDRLQSTAPQPEGKGKEVASSGETIKWVSASERLPDKEGPLCIKINGGYMTAYLHIKDGSKWLTGNSSFTIRNFKQAEWLNESASPSDTREEAIKFAEWILTKNRGYLRNDILVTVDGAILTADQLHDLYTQSLNP